MRPNEYKTAKIEGPSIVAVNSKRKIGNAYTDLSEEYLLKEGEKFVY
jgi:hypothetical protein